MCPIEQRTIRSKVIHKIHIIRPEIRAPKRRIIRDSKASRASARQRSIQVRRHGQRAREGVVSCPGLRGPDDVHGVGEVGFRVVRLAQEVGWAAARDVHLFCVVAGCYEDYVGV